MMSGNEFIGKQIDDLKSTLSSKISSIDTSDIHYDSQELDDEERASDDIEKIQNQFGSDAIITLNVELQNKDEEELAEKEENYGIKFTFINDKVLVTGKVGDLESFCDDLTIGDKQAQLEFWKTAKQTKSSKRSSREEN